MHVWSGRSPDFKNEEYVVSYLLSGQGPASSLNCPVILFSEYWSTRNDLKPFALGAHLSSASILSANLGPYF